MMNKFIKDKILKTCKLLNEGAEQEVLKVERMKYISCGYKENNELPMCDEKWEDFGREDTVSGKDCHFWFYFELKTPKCGENQSNVLRFATKTRGRWDNGNPQGIVYVNGELVQGIDMNHREVQLEADKEYKIYVYFYIGMTDEAMNFTAALNLVNLSVLKLYYDLKVPYDAAMCFDENEYNRIVTIKYLEHACNIIDLRDTESKEFFESVQKADEYIKSEYYEKVCGKTDAVVSYIGHTHIDVAWLWTLAQTREKVQRSFSTVLALMEQYPEYVFMSSQPQLYEYLKKEAPEVFEKVKEMVKKGRWEAEGAMWLEADCNLSSGESLVRQIIYGKRFLKEEFGVDSHILWLPDVFGYSAALPQILKKTGVDAFVTSKISWNDTNQMPYDTFMWEGIDGTEIFSYFLTATTQDGYNKGKVYTTYNGNITPQMNLGTWERYQQKEYNNETIVTFGYGDGGGGPTAEMIEYEKRLEYGLPGMPKTQMSFAGDFLNRVRDNFDKACEELGRTPRWVGELYLEFHRGTYTSMAKNKRNNRKCEFLCQDTETLSVADEILQDHVYPQKELHMAWKTILLNQFHDIIPGSSIKEVYEESDREYAEIKENIGNIKTNTLLGIAGNLSERGIMVYNPNSFEASGYVKFENGLIYAENIPPMGWKVISDSDAGKVKIKDKRIESSHYTISFDDNMNISSIFDKDNDREVLSAAANRICAFEDRPIIYDNWELSSVYKQKKYEINDVESCRVLEGIGFGGFEIKRRYMHSTITQKIVVYAKSRRIDVENEIDWHEHHTVLKAIFPVDIHASKAMYDIQFANVERPNHDNTSWEEAKFEVCAHKWADLSEEDYGVSILNDCKYGYGIRGNEITLTLLKCGTDPNKEADQGRHIFTYSIYPHKDNARRGGTIDEAYLLNRPMSTYVSDGNGKLPKTFSLISCDCENIVIETVKKAENGNGIIVRLNDAWDKKSTPELTFGFDAKAVYICDMLENKEEKIGSGNKVKINVNNFEIVTLLIER